MRWRASLLVVLLAVVAMSCDQQPVEPSDAQVAAVPSFNFSNGPSEVGVVIRTQLYGTWWREYWDHDPPLCVEMTPAEDLGDYVGLYDCGGSYDIPLYDVQVAGDLDKNRLHVVGLKKSPVYVYNCEDLYEAFLSEDNEIFCNFYMNDWIYGGEANFTWTDNNFWGDPQYTNPFGFTGNGFVWDHDGVRYNFYERLLMYYNPARDYFDVKRDELFIH